MGNLIVGGVLLIAVILAIRSVKRRAESGCCGGSCDSVELSCVSDTNPEHYPHSAELRIEGMHCEKCKSRLEKALNALTGVWTTVKLQDGTALVRMKKLRTEAELREVVRKAGYSVQSYSRMQ